MHTAIQICVLTAFSVVPQKFLDSQMLLDPFEEQFHLPSLALQVRNELGLECHVVGQEAESFPFVVFGRDAPDGVGIIFFWNIQRQNPNLIADGHWCSLCPLVANSCVEIWYCFWSWSQRMLGIDESC